MHLRCPFVDVPFGIQIAMKNAARDAPVDEFDAADFDDAMLLLDFEPRGFGVEHDLAHALSLPDYS
jgi:hypothetical protein